MKYNSDIVNVVYCSSDLFSEVCAVAIVSLFENNKHLKGINVFVIDDQGIVRAILVYPLNVGRFIPEIIRIVEALQMADCSKSSTPANWLPNQPVIMSAPRTFPLLQERLDYINQNCNGMSWYLAFQDPKQECLNKINCENNDNC